MKLRGCVLDAFRNGLYPFKVGHRDDLLYHQLRIVREDVRTFSEVLSR